MHTRATRFDYNSLSKWLHTASFSATECCLRCHAEVQSLGLKNYRFIDFSFNHVLHLLFIGPNFDSVTHPLWRALLQRAWFWATLWYPTGRRRVTQILWGGVPEQSEVRRLGAIDQSAWRIWRCCQSPFLLETWCSFRSKSGNSAMKEFEVIELFFIVSGVWKDDGKIQKSWCQETTVGSQTWIPKIRGSSRSYETQPISFPPHICIYDYVLSF